MAEVDGINAENSCDSAGSEHHHNQHQQQHQHQHQHTYMLTVNVPSTPAVQAQQMGTVMLLEPRPFRPFKSSEEYLWAMKEDLAEWLNALYGLDIAAETFMEKLETGVTLCCHANRVRRLAMERHREGKNGFNVPIPNKEVVYRTEVSPGTFHSRDNVSNFISWCRGLGIYECLLFETDDLVLRKNEKSFILCLLEVARRGAKFGMPAPLLVQLEEEIDREIAKDNEKKQKLETGVEDDYSSEEEDLEPPPQIITNDLKSLDEMVRDLVNRCTCPVQFPMIRVSEGKYRIGDTQTLIFVRILRSHVMVRVGGGWDTLEHYLDKHDPCRCRQGHRTTVSSKVIVKHSPYTPNHASMQVTYERSPEPCRTQGSSRGVAGSTVTSSATCNLQHLGSPQRVRRASNSSLPSLASKSSTGSLASTGSEKLDSATGSSSVHSRDLPDSRSSSRPTSTGSDTYIVTTPVTVEAKYPGTHHSSRRSSGGAELMPGKSIPSDRCSEYSDEGYQSGSRGRKYCPRKLLQLNENNAIDGDGGVVGGESGSECSSIFSADNRSLPKQLDSPESPSSPVDGIQHHPVLTKGPKAIQSDKTNRISDNLVQKEYGGDSLVDTPDLNKNEDGHGVKQSPQTKKSKIPHLNPCMRPRLHYKSQSSEDLNNKTRGMPDAGLLNQLSKERHSSGDPRINSVMTRSRSQCSEGSDMANYLLQGRLGRNSYRSVRNLAPSSRIPRAANNTWSFRTHTPRPALTPDVFSRPPKPGQKQTSPYSQRRSSLGANIPTSSRSPRSQPSSLQSSPNKSLPPLLQEVLSAGRSDEQLLRKMEEILEQYKARKNSGQHKETEHEPATNFKHSKGKHPEPPTEVIPGENYTKHWVATTATAACNDGESDMENSPHFSGGSHHRIDDGSLDFDIQADQWSRAKGDPGSHSSHKKSSTSGGDVNNEMPPSPATADDGFYNLDLGRPESPGPSNSGSSRIPTRVSMRKDAMPGSTRIPMPTFYST